MRVIVCGGRNYADWEYLSAFLDDFHKLFTITVVIHGDASGADGLADKWAKSRGVVVESYPAEWTKYGRRAGPIRNSLMASKNPDCTIAFPGGNGTMDMVNKSHLVGIPAIEIGVDS